MGFFQRLRTGVRNAVNKVKEIGSRIMQGVTHVAGKAVDYVEQAAMLMHWDGIAEASREVGEALQEKHDRWKERADRIQHERLVGPNTKPKQFKPSREVRAVGEAAIQAIEAQIGPNQDLHETISRQTPQERLELIERVSNEMAQRHNLKLEPIKYFFSDDLHFGNYSPSENCIRINASLVASENTYMAMEQLFTVIHETMHAIQHHAIEQEKAEAGSSGFDPQLVCDWANNFLRGHYIRPEVDPEGYRNQSVERDAYGIEWIMKNHFNNNNN